MAQYLQEFPDFDHDVAEHVAFLLANGFEDVSWANDGGPSFMCDVFVLYMDYADPKKRKEEELEGGPLFLMKCEDVPYLESDDFADVIAFIIDGKRDFPAYEWKV